MANKSCLKCNKIATKKNLCNGHYAKLWRSKNKERTKAASQQWKQSHKKEHSQYQTEYVRQRLSNDHEYRLRKNLRARLYRALKRNTKSGSAIKDLGCSIAELKKHLEFQFEPLMTWDNWGQGDGKWQIDHIIPFCNIDLSNTALVKMACHYTNLQPLWQKEHFIKTAKDRHGKT